VKLFFILFISACLISSCASLEGSIGLGAGIGATTGVVTGKFANLNVKGMALTGAAGALVGGVIGFLLYKKPSDLEKTQSDTAPFVAPGQEPILKDAEKDMIWIPGTIQGDRYVEPHRMWTIKVPSRWAHPDKKNSEKKEDRP
jgi:hypothetical protein